MDAALFNNIPTTPAFVLDKAQVLRNLQILHELRAAAGCKTLYSIKALPFSAVLDWVSPYVDGFSVSSLFEARLAAEYLPQGKTLHLTTPGLKAEEMPELGALCGHIAFNSLNQLRSFGALLPAACTPGLRVNPQWSALNDDRFDPCRRHSKLGVAIAVLQEQGIPQEVKGLHVHNSFSATSLQPLQYTVMRLREMLHPQLRNLQWLNLGGGYLFEQIADLSLFSATVGALRQDYGLEVFIEPGKAVVGNAAYLVASVVDCFSSDGESIAVLDSSVNHHPELFEYRRSAELVEPQPEQGGYRTILAGCSCLAGDLFGTFRYPEPLKVGDKVAFKNIGAYSLIKASRFNGYNFPDIYVHDNGRVQLLKHYTYQDYRGQWLAEQQREA